MQETSTLSLSEILTFTSIMDSFANNRQHSLLGPMSWQRLFLLSTVVSQWWMAPRVAQASVSRGPMLRSGRRLVKASLFSRQPMAQDSKYFILFLHIEASVDFFLVKASQKKKKKRKRKNNSTTGNVSSEIMVTVYSKVNPEAAEETSLSESRYHSTQNTEAQSHWHCGTQCSTLSPRPHSLQGMQLHVFPGRDKKKKKGAEIKSHVLRTSSSLSHLNL